jgi:hypothetical protein
MSSDSVVDHIDWKELKGKEARGIHKKVDLGEIQEIGTMYVVTKKGRVSTDKFYIPKYLAQSYDGKRVLFDVSEDMMEEFRRDTPPSAEEYARYKRTDMPADIEEKVIVVTEVPVDTEAIERTTTIEETTVPATTAAAQTSRASQESRSDMPVVDWENTLHKGVRSMEREPVGNVIALYPDSIHVESEGSRIKYDIPKSEVEGFDGAEVRLKAPIVDLERYIKDER